MSALHLTAKKGDTFTEVPFVINIDGVPLDLTGATIRMQLRVDYGGKVYLDLKSDVADGGITITDATNGAFKIDERVIGLEARSYKYDIEITLASGEINTWIEGTFKVINDVTR